MSFELQQKSHCLQLLRFIIKYAQKNVSFYHSLKVGSSFCFHTKHVQTIKVHSKTVVKPAMDLRGEGGDAMDAPLTIKNSSLSCIFGDKYDFTSY